MGSLPSHCMNSRRGSCHRWKYYIYGSL